MGAAGGEHDQLTPPAGRLGWYLAAWVPAGGLVVLLLVAGAGYSPAQAVGLAAPLTLVFAAAGLGVRFTCRVLPLRPHAGQAVAVQIVTALIAGGLWAGLGLLLLLSWGWPAHRATVPLLWSAGALFHLLVAAGFYLALAIERAGEAERRAADARLLAREAELRALKAQVNPHFLYNSLNSISALAVADPEGARAMCARLGDFLRSSLALGGEPEMISLNDELALARTYLQIEHVRFGERLAVEERIAPEALAIRIPTLLLQPLLENAIVHGIAGRLEGGCIRIEAEADAAQLRLRIANPYDAEERRPGAGVGLSNVSQRLRALFGDAASLEVAAAEGEFRVSLRLPRLPATTTAQVSERNGNEATA